MSELCATCPYTHGCHPSCPEYKPPPAVFVCSGCGHDIYEGEDYWDIMGEQFCKKCIDDARGEAEYDPY